MISADMQRAALELVNARRAQAGLAPLPGFAAYAPASPPDPEDELRRGQSALEKRRAELLTPPHPPASTPLNIWRAAPPERPPAPAEPSSARPAAKRAARRPSAPAPLPTDPQHVASWPQVALGAARLNGAGGVRAWELARALDRPGSGWVARKDLLGWLSRLGVSRSTRNRWVRDAVQLGLLRKARGGAKLLYASLAGAASTFGVADPGQRVLVTARELAARGWKQAAWVGALARFTGPVSRAALRAVTGVDPRSQRNYERRYKARAEGLRVLANYAVDGLHDAASIDGYREFRRKYAFVVRTAGSEQIAYRLPNTYQVDPSCIRTAGGQYRSWKIRLAQAAARAACARRPGLAQVVVSDCSGQAPGAPMQAQPRPAGDGAGSRAGAACAVGDANPGERRRSAPERRCSERRCTPRRYFERSRSLKRALRRVRAGKRPAADMYEFLAGGIARKRNPFASCRWWRLVGEGTVC